MNRLTVSLALSGVRHSAACLFLVAHLEPSRRVAILALRPLSQFFFVAATELSASLSLSRLLIISPRAISERLF